MGVAADHQERLRQQNLRQVEGIDALRILASWTTDTPGGAVSRTTD
ncbi:hypothetical protein [Streptomyces sp. NBC_01237]|nr:hypothetical protein [Streptomyces sp. NBC_01237]WRZ70609.1 hypothetical protein OG251_02740 [Streptomyces sp. NBC_01237]